MVFVVSDGEDNVRVLPNFTELEGSSSCSRKVIIGLYPKPYESSSHLISLPFCVWFSQAVCSFDFLTKRLCAFLSEC